VVWAGDITSVWTTEGWLSRAVVLALYSHAVIGWALEAQLTGDLTQQTLTIRHRTPKAGLLHHSDRGRASMPPRPTSNCLPLAGRQGTAEDGGPIPGFRQN
jgi:transposase InsO family protein